MHKKSKSNNNKVLLITYLFPPIGGAGALRSVKFAKYLAKQGWEPLILTIKDILWPIKDLKLINDLSNDIRIFRTFSFDHRKLLNKIKNFVVKRPKRQDIPGSKIANKGSKNVLGQLYCFFSDVLSFPDYASGWIPFAFFKGIWIIKKFKIKIIYTTSAPYSTHLVGFLLKKTTGIKWVADFRDAWSQAPLWRFPSNLHYKLAEWLEKKILETADKITTVSEPIKNDFIRKYPALSQGKIVVITNGYDGEDFAGRPLVEAKNDRFTVVYCGSFYGGYSPEIFLKSINKLLLEMPEIRDKIRLIFVGSFGDNYELVESLNLNEITQIKGFLTHKEAIQYLSIADLLLFILYDIPGSEGVYSCKLFEYLVSGKPILALIPNNVAADLIRKANAGTIVNPQNVNEIKNAFLDYYNKWVSGNLKGCINWDVIREYDRGVLTEKLAGVFDEIIAAQDKKE